MSHECPRCGHCWPCFVAECDGAYKIECSTCRESALSRTGCAPILLFLGIFDAVAVLVAIIADAIGGIQ